MNKQEEFKDDILTRYIRPEKIDKAPAGFTGRVMTRIRTEKITVTTGNRFFSEYKVPLISFGITVLLIITVVITYSANKDSLFIAYLKPVSDLIDSVAKISFGKLEAISVPGWFGYSMTGILLLAVFDRVLNTLFHKEGRKGVKA
jgi:hypothetical protein